MYLASQIIVFIGIAFGLASFQFKKHRHMMLSKFTHEMLSSIHYILLGQYTGAAMNLLGAIRNLLFSRLVAKGKKTTGYVILFGFLFVLAGVLAWQGPKSLLVICAKILSCIAYGCKDTAVVRKISLFTNAFWFLYNLIIFSVTAFLCDSLMLLSVIISILRYDLIPHIQKKRSEKD